MRHSTNCLHLGDKVRWLTGPAEWEVIAFHRDRVTIVRDCAVAAARYGELS